MSQASAAAAGPLKPTSPLRPKATSLCPALCIPPASMATHQQCDGAQNVAPKCYVEEHEQRGTCGGADSLRHSAWHVVPEIHGAQRCHRPVEAVDVPAVGGAWCGSGGEFFLRDRSEAMGLQGCQMAVSFTAVS